MKTYQKLWYLLPESQHPAATAMLCFMFVGMLMEMLGVGLIIPALVIMAENDLASKYPITVPWLNMLGNPSQAALVIGGMVALVGAYTFKTLFLSFFAWRQATFASKIESDISRRLFEGYMRQPYAFHLQRNSAQLIRNTPWSCFWNFRCHSARLFVDIGSTGSARHLGNASRRRTVWRSIGSECLRSGRLELQSIYPWLHAALG
jgi:ABC-type multidrug transport system fused ATPase/permease subunit